MKQAGLARAAAVMVAALACWSPVQASADDPRDDARAALQAVTKGEYEDAIRLFDKALAQPDLTSEERTDITLHRAFAYDEAGDYGRAIADYDAVLAAKPDAGQVYFRRGLAHRENGELAQALADFDIAMRPSRGNVPDWPVVYGDRGVVLFALGRFAEAAGDFSHVLSMEPADAYALLWRHLARSRTGAADPEDFSGRAGKIPGDQWPKPLLALFQGKASPAAVLAAAAEGDDEARQNQQCEADFFLGEQALLRGNSAEAKPLLGKVVDTCAPSLAVHTAAIGELARLGE